MTRHIELEISVHTSAERVWEVLADPATHPRWRPTVRVFRTLDGGPLREGAKVEEVVVHRGKEYRSLIDVTAFEPAERLCLVCTEGPVPFTFAIGLHGHDDHSHVHFALDLDPPKVLGVRIPFYGAFMMRFLREEAAGLAEIAESAGP